jgi:hypothetical protein
MEYASIIQPLVVIFISFSMGMFFGGLLMFNTTYKTEKELKKELDKFRKLYYEK